MPIHHEILRNWTIPDRVEDVSPRDVQLYALSLNLGADPLDPVALPYVLERDLRVLPSMATVLGRPDRWAADPATGITYSQLVVASVSLDLHAALPSAGRVRGRHRVTALVDKGPGRGALLETEKLLVGDDDGTVLATMRQRYFLRADGGFLDGRNDPEPAPLPACPDRRPDIEADLESPPWQALLYRLTGDMNPLHAYPDVAAAAGFPRPILHGLASFGLAGWHLARHLCGGDAQRTGHLSCRFTAPVFPGDALRLQIWREGPSAMFRVLAPARDRVVLDNGVFAALPPG